MHVPDSYNYIPQEYQSYLEPQYMVVQDIQGCTSAIPAN